MSDPPIEPPTWRERLSTVVVREAPDAVDRAVAAADTAKGYLPWSRFRHRPAPPEWTAEELWTLVKLRRDAAAKRLELLRQKGGRPFWLVQSDPLLAALHRIDTREALWKGLRDAGEGPGSAVGYRLLAALEEAHHSSAIEGAVTTRRQSLELLRSGREPRDRSERMVRNNFATVERLEEWSREPLTPELVLTVQDSLTRGTLDDPADVGRLRADDGVRIVDELSGELVFQPPAALELGERIERLCCFANAAPDEGGGFVHPITRAILIHHQLAYDHPFTDGNGRTARALFLWSLLRGGYSWFRSLSISRAVHRARNAYYASFRHVQSDEGDVTYFVRQQLRCIELEIEHLAAFLERRARLERWLAGRDAALRDLNPRQVALVEHALGNPRARFTSREHAQHHGVSQPTAWKDLTGLVERELLDEGKLGRRAVYDVSERLRRLAEEQPPS